MFWILSFCMSNALLIPTDGSQHTETIVEQAITLSDPQQTRIHILYVIDHRALLPLQTDERESVAESLTEAGESAVQTVSEAIKRHDSEYDITTFVAQGIPAEQIIAYVQEHDIDTVVLGSHGQTMQNQAIGSTTERVVQGVNHLGNTIVVVVPIGDEQERLQRQQEITEQAKGMFQ